MYPVLTSGGTGRERLEAGLEQLCELLDRHLPLMLATDEAFHQATGPTSLPTTCTRSSGSFARVPRTAPCLPSTTSSRPRTSRSTAAAWPYVHLRGRHEWTAERARARVVGLVLNGVAGAAGPRHPAERRHDDHDLAVSGAARPARARRTTDPRAAAARRARRPAVRDLHERDDERRLVGRELDAAPAGRRQPAGGRLAREPRARRLVRRPARRRRRRLRPGRGACRAGDPLAGRRRAASTSTGGATAAPTSTCGSSRGRWGWSRRRG